MLEKLCANCGSKYHYQTFCPYKKRKAIAKRSHKEEIYQTWKETIARPYLIKRDGNICKCCKRPAYDGEKLDIEHKLGKGSHPELKAKLSNLRLYCRIPCHENKTKGLPCKH